MDDPGAAKEIAKLKAEIQAFHSLLEEIKEAFEDVRESARSNLDGTTVISSSADGSLIAMDCLIEDPVGCISWAFNIPDESIKDKLTYEDGLRLRYQQVPELEAIVENERQKVIKSRHDGRPG